MRRFIAVALALVFVVALCAAYGAEAKEGTWHGVITDDMCGKKHMGNDEKACALKCVEQGAKFALYDRKADKLFALTDQTKAKAFVAEPVVVKGTLSEDGTTITVKEIQKGEGKKEGGKEGR